jgi:ABC-type lipoprotein release transport system permease subunit
VGKGPAGELLVSPEFLYTGEVAHASAHARITVRGVGPTAFLVHRKLEGAPPVGGDLLLGANIRNLLPGIAAGDPVMIAGRQWRVGGFFRTHGRQSAFDSEIWAPLEPLMQARKAQSYGTITMKAARAALVPELVGTINANLDLLKSVRAVPEHRAEDLQSTARAFDAVYTTFSVLLLGVAGTAMLSLFLNNVMRRASDMALLRALGSSAEHIAVGFIVEDVLVALPGAALGVLAAAPFAGMTIRTGSGNRLGLVAVRLEMGPATVTTVLFVMLALSAVCAILPAFFASRFTVKQGLRAP